MRWLTIALIALIALLQYPLWLGKGGWLKVWDASRQLEEQKVVTRKLELRNSGLDAEVRDLKQGYEAIEERARYELGMIKEGEVFVQLPERPMSPPAAKPAVPAAASPAPPTAAKPLR